MKFDENMFECGPGWHPTIHKLHRILSDICPDYTVLQIKEKFGRLAYYFSVPQQIRDDVWKDMAGWVGVFEDLTATICEMCGVDARTKNINGWYRTWCEECLEDWKVNRDRIFAKYRKNDE